MEGERLPLIPVVAGDFVAFVEAGGEAHDDEMPADFSAADGDAFSNAKCGGGDDG